MYSSCPDLWNRDSLTLTTKMCREINVVQGGIGKINVWINLETEYPIEKSADNERVMDAVIRIT